MQAGFGVERRLSVPRGSRHHETGILNDHGQGYALRRDGGGTWRLDVSPDERHVADALVGKRVRVLGTRADFDLLDVLTLEPDSGR